MSQNGDIEEKVVESTTVAKVREVIARHRKVGSGAPGALRGRRELVLAPQVLQRALPDVATLLKDSMTSALGPRKETAAHELARATKKRVYEDKRQNTVQPDSGLKPHEATQPQYKCQMFEDMFDLTSHARTHNGPARSYSRARKAPKSPAVFDDTGHQTQMNRKQTEDTLKPNGHSGKQVPDVSELASTADSHSGHKNESLMQDTVTVKENIEDKDFEIGVSLEAAWVGLYKDHQIKDELVLGPVFLQPRDVACIVQNNNEKEQTSTVNSATAIDEKSVSQDSVTVKVEPEERCFDEGVTEAVRVDHLEYQIKDELVRDERCFEECVSAEAVEIGLYKDHQIKDELVLGPVLLQPRDVAFIVQNNNEKEPTSCATHKHSILQRHEKEHTSNKPFKCSYCAYATHQYCILQEHEKLHMSDKPFKCSYCNYTARYKSRLTKHELKHSFKRFKCSHCDYTTRYKAHVTRHELRHSKP